MVLHMGGNVNLLYCIKNDIVIGAKIENILSLHHFSLNTMKYWKCLQIRIVYPQKVSGRVAYGKHFEICRCLKKEVDFQDVHDYSELLIVIASCVAKMHYADCLLRGIILQLMLCCQIQYELQPCCYYVCFQTLNV